MGWMVDGENGAELSGKPVELGNAHLQVADGGDSVEVVGVEPSGRLVRLPCDGPCGGNPKGECAWVLWREVLHGDGSRGPIGSPASPCPVQRARLASRGHASLVEQEIRLHAQEEGSEHGGSRFVRGQVPGEKPAGRRYAADDFGGR